MSDKKVYLVESPQFAEAAEKLEAIRAGISNISTLSFEAVQTLPTQDIKTNVIYLVPKSTAGTDNIYDEWVYINSDWELIGTTEIDLSNYYTKTEIDTALAKKMDVYYEQPIGKLERDINIPTHGDGTAYKSGDLFFYNGILYRYAYTYSMSVVGAFAIYSKIGGHSLSGVTDPPSSQSNNRASEVNIGDTYIKCNYSTNNYVFYKKFVCTYISFQSSYYHYIWTETPIDIYSKTEINTMIGNVETLLSQV